MQNPLLVKVHVALNQTLKIFERLHRRQSALARNNLRELPPFAEFSNKVNISIRFIGSQKLDHVGVVDHQEGVYLVLQQNMHYFIAYLL